MIDNKMDLKELREIFKDKLTDDDIKKLLRVIELIAERIAKRNIPMQSDPPRRF